MPVWLHLTLSVAFRVNFRFCGFVPKCSSSNHLQPSVFFFHSVPPSLPDSSGSPMHHIASCLPALTLAEPFVWNALPFSWSSSSNSSSAWQMGRVQEGSLTFLLGAPRIPWTCLDCMTYSIVIACSPRPVTWALSFLHPGSSSRSGTKEVSRSVEWMLANHPQAEMLPSHWSSPTLENRGTSHLLWLSRVSCPALADSTAGSRLPWVQQLQNLRASHGLSSLCDSVKT